MQARFTGVGGFGVLALQGALEVARLSPGPRLLRLRMVGLCALLQGVFDVERRAGGGYGLRELDGCER